MMVKRLFEIDILANFNFNVCFGAALNATARVVICYFLPFATNKGEITSESAVTIKFNSTVRRANSMSLLKAKPSTISTAAGASPK